MNMLTINFPAFSFRGLPLFVISILLVGCGGSDVGGQSDDSPLAKATVLGAGQSADGSYNVRSGSEVLISGKDSDGIDDPLLAFHWQVVGVTGDIALSHEDFENLLVERTSNTKQFSTPIVSTDTTVEFELTVTDADGKTDTDSVVINILPINDLDVYLQQSAVLNLGVNQFSFVAMAEEDQISTGSIVPFTIDFRLLAEWEDALGSKVLEVLDENYANLSAEWTKDDDENLINPTFSLKIPALDLDDINRRFEATGRENRLELHKVDTASLFFEIRFDPAVTAELVLTTGSELDLTLTTSSTNPGASPIPLQAIDDIRKQLNIPSKDSAQAYYKLIDPEDQFLTLDKWLTFRKFTENGSASDAAHTIYLNNYDLGFGRDMYMRTDECGNVFSYVENYPTLESTLLGQNNFATVVMEYSPLDNNAPHTPPCSTEEKIVKFYAYVPDEVNGGAVRANRMNFDGRGEKFMPGVCTACHGGNVFDGSTADLDSTFMPFDLDAYLYTHSDLESEIEPSISVDASGTPQNISQEQFDSYSRAAQEEEFRLLNQQVLSTYYDAGGSLDSRHLPSINLINFWYNDDILSEIFEGVKETGGARTPPIGWEGSADIYYDVYAKNCRACHVQLGPTTEDANDIAFGLAFETWDDLLEYKEVLIERVYEQGTMPLARLTMDRFWVDFHGASISESPAELLRAALEVPDMVSKPGDPTAKISPEEAADENVPDITLDFDKTQTFSAVGSLFVDDYLWTLDDVPVSSDNQFIFEAGNPGEAHILTLTTTNLLSSIDARETRTISVNQNSPDPVSFSMDVQERTTSTIEIYRTLCPDFETNPASCRTKFGDIISGETPTIQVDQSSVSNLRNLMVDNAAGTLTYTTEDAVDSMGASNMGAFSYTLTDSFGEAKSADVEINIILPGEPAARPDICATMAITASNSDDFPLSLFPENCESASPLTNDMGTGVVITSVTQSAEGSHAELNGANILYTPPTFFSDDTDIFNYTVTESASANRTSTSMISISIGSTTKYSGLEFQTTQTECAVCHGSTFYPSAPEWTADTLRQRLTINNELIDIEPGAATSTAMILETYLFQYACSTSHTGSNTLCNDGVTLPMEASDLNEHGSRVLTWVQEGAKNN